MGSNMNRIYCAICEKEVDYNLVSGEAIYPHRKDLYTLKFAQCKYCKGYVGTHRKTAIPLGSIVSKEVKTARSKIHSLIDPLWKSGKIRRTHLYSKISAKIGKNFHTANIRTLQEAESIYHVCSNLKEEVMQ